MTSNMMMTKIFMMLSRERNPETAQALLCAFLRAHFGDGCGDSRGAVAAREAVPG
jgi:hypothetical protein